MRRWVAPAALAAVAVLVAVTIHMQTSNVYVIDRVSVSTTSGWSVDVRIPANITLAANTTYFIDIRGVAGSTYRIQGFGVPLYMSYPCYAPPLLWWDRYTATFVFNATYTISLYPMANTWIYIAPLPDRGVKNASAYPACASGAVA
jgi:hypothetical protein